MLLAELSAPYSGSVEASCAAPAVTLLCSVFDMSYAAPDILRFRLRMGAGDHLHYLPGQHVDLQLVDGQRRSYSIAGPRQHEGLLEFHVRVRPNSAFVPGLHESAQRGWPVQLTGPYGRGYLRERLGRSLLLIAGGTGYAPLRSIILSLLDGDDMRVIHLYWGARRAADFYEDGLLKERSVRSTNLRYVPVLADADSGAHWTGRVGPVHLVALDEHAHLHGSDICVSGPPGLLQAVRESCAVRGVDPARLFLW